MRRTWYLSFGLLVYPSGRVYPRAEGSIFLVYIRLMDRPQLLSKFSPDSEGRDGKSPCQGSWLKSSPHPLSQGWRISRDQSGLKNKGWETFVWEESLWICDGISVRTVYELGVIICHCKITNDSQDKQVRRTIFSWRQRPLFRATVPIGARP